ncbi:MAG: FtsX-like permease family protein [Syntrophales bacterium]
MMNLYKIALRNLLRYKRRTLLTASLITVGVVFVLIFVAVSGSFKAMMIGQITDAMLGHIQIHKKGYVASIDNLPLNLNLNAQTAARIDEFLGKQKNIEAFSPRLKFGGLFSNFVESTNIRLNGIYPEREFKTVPLLTSRISEGRKTIAKGEIIIPALLAKGMKVKVGDSVVIVATNKDGSVNGKQFVVAGIMEGVTGPGGRDGYVHIEDAAEVLRMPELEISEVAIRLKDFDRLQPAAREMEKQLTGEFRKDDKFPLEIHTWEGLSPFANVARMLDIMTFFIKLMLVALVLISVLNVMMMAVYERIREIGTMAAIGTPPGKILMLFMMEGLSLGILGAIIGGGAGLLILFILNAAHITFNFGQQQGLLLQAYVKPMDFAAIAVIVILVSVVASLQPAFKASRMEPIVALRHV